MKDKEMPKEKRLEPKNHDEPESYHQIISEECVRNDKSNGIQ